jgi:hypothetical protein
MILTLSDELSSKNEKWVGRVQKKSLIGEIDLRAQFFAIISRQHWALLILMDPLKFFSITYCHPREKFYLVAEAHSLETVINHDDNDDDRFKEVLDWAK